MAAGARSVGVRRVTSRTLRVPFELSAGTERARLVNNLVADGGPKCSFETENGGGTEVVSAVEDAHQRPPRGLSQVRPGADSSRPSKRQRSLLVSVPPKLPSEVGSTMAAVRGPSPDLGADARQAAEIRRVLEEVSAALERVSLLVPEAVERARALLDKPRFEVLVLGEFSRGKSTLINGLIGAPLLPKGLRPTTAAITRLTSGEQLTIRVQRKDGSSEDLEPRGMDDATAKLAQCVTVSGAAAATVRCVDVSVPSTFLGSGVVLVDTPGTQDIDIAHDQITYEYLPHADAALFLLDAAKPLTETEQVFLRDCVLTRDLHRLLFVLNRADTVSDPADVARRTTERIQAALPIADPVVVSVSAKAFLRAQREGDAAGEESSGGPALRRALRQFLAAGPARIQRERALDLARRGLDGVATQVDGIVEALREDGARVSEKLQEEEVQLQEGQRRLAIAVEEFRRDRSSVSRRIELAIEEAADLLRGKLEFAFSLDDLWAIRSAVGRMQREFVESVLSACTSELRRAYAFMTDRLPDFRVGSVASVPDEEWNTGLGIEEAGPMLEAQGNARSTGGPLVAAGAALLLGAATAGIGVGIGAALLGFLGGEELVVSARLRDAKTRMRKAADLWVSSVRRRVGEDAAMMIEGIDQVMRAEVLGPIEDDLQRRRAGLTSLSARLSADRDRLEEERRRFADLRAAVANWIVQLGARGDA